MSWSIQVLENNTLRISKEVAKELFEAQAYEEEIWYELEDVIDSKGFLQFNSDHDEHMDYLSNNKHMIKILQESMVNGRILFCSHEGDNAGSYWGHHFEDGSYSKLKGYPGTITWKKSK